MTLKRVRGADYGGGHTRGRPIPNEHRDGGYFYMDTNGDIWQVNYGNEYSSV
jgi:hypothetical protein